MEAGAASWTERAIVAALALALFVALVGARQDVGMPIDEVYYLFAADRYADWLVSPAPADPAARRAQRDAAWGVNHEHPPLAKLAYGLSGRLLAGRLGKPGAYRAVASLVFAGLAAGLYFTARRAWGRAAGVGAALALVASPRLVGHGLIAALDLPAAAACFAAVLAFHGAGRSRARALLFGVLLGLAAAVKLNALLLPLGLVLWAELYRPRSQQQAYAAMLVVAPLVLILVWPWLWADPVARLLEYLSFFTHQYKAPTWYFGVRYQDPPAPWHYPFVMTAVTIPVAALLLVVAGIAALARDRFRDSLGALALVSALVQLAAVARPGQIKYDGERTYLAAFPFLFLLAGFGFAWLAEAVAPLVAFRGRARPGLAAGLLAVACFAWPLVAVIRQHPFELNYYSGLVGGMPGALRAGLESSSWGAHVAGREVREWANANLPAGATIDTNAGSFATLNYYREVGLLRKDIQFQANARYWFLEVCQGYASGPWWWDLYADRSPGYRRVKGFAKDGVPLLNVFERVSPPAPAVPAPVSGDAR